MSDEQDRRRAPWGALSVYVVVAIGAIGLAVGGVGQDRPELLGAGLIGLMIVAAALPIAWITATSPERAGGTEDAQLRRRLIELRQAIERFGETSLLSDDARRVINRARERELLRKAIEEDIHSEDWDAAMVLVKELAERFGYRADAEEFRRRIEAARHQTDEKRVSDAIAGLDRLITQCRWAEADQEAGRVIRLFPDALRVEGLRHRVSHARQRYKEQLERRFLHAAQAGKVDEAMVLLKELDNYLSEAEAAPFQEVARGVIGKARENLGVQFKLSVQDRNWPRAAAVGQQIIDEFPNTKMAEEIREMIDQIRERASVVRA